MDKKEKPIWADLQNQKKHPQVNGHRIFVQRRIAQSWCVRSPGLFAHHLSEAQSARLCRHLNKVIQEFFFPVKKGGAYSRRKGHAFEREMVKALRKVFPKARRQLEFQKECALGVDIAETGSYRFQCKKLKKYAPVSTLEEIQHDPIFGERPVVLTAGDNLPPVAIMPFSDFLDLLERAEGASDRAKFEKELDGL